VDSWGSIHSTLFLDLGTDVAQIVFEFMIFITTWWNALDQPLPQHAKMAKVLYRDGSIYFFVSSHHGCCWNQLTPVRFYLVDLPSKDCIDYTHTLSGLRLLNLVLSIVSPVSLLATSRQSAYIFDNSISCH
jgi:hypothetical protein